MNTVNRVFSEEAEAVLKLQSLSQSCADAIKIIGDTEGPLILSGVGKSGHVASKIASTFCSLGKPAIFVHAAEASHGELGIVSPTSLVIAFSNSGETTELSDLLAYCKQYKIKLIAITGRGGSTLAKAADHAIVYDVKQEACRNNLAPTTSTTVAMAIGDALAVGFSEYKNVTAEDFRRYHPGGLLADYLKTARDVMKPASKAPTADKGASIQELLLIMTEGQLGIGILMDGESVFGVVSDGDLRRNASKLDSIVPKEIATRTPVTVPIDMSTREIRNVMKDKGVSQVLVEEDGQFAGIVHVLMLGGNAR